MMEDVAFSARMHSHAVGYPDSEPSDPFKVMLMKQFCLLIHHFFVFYSPKQRLQFILPPGFQMDAFLWDEKSELCDTV